MVTLLVYAALAIVVVAALVAVAVLLLPGTEQLTPAPADRTPWALPAERAMTGPDVGRLRLPVTLRGYRFAETDAVLDRLGEEIAYRDAVIATLRAELETQAVLADPEREVLGAAPASRLAAGHDGLVELGETPEETEAGAEAGPEADIGSGPEVGDDPEAETEAETEAHESAAGEAPEADGPRVVELDEELSDLEPGDDTPPEGPAPRDHR